jgi:hypothetical protein
METKPWQESDLQKRKEIAERQLEEWQKRAEYWHTFPVHRDGRDMMVCGVCEQSLWFIKDRFDELFSYAVSEIMTLVVAHIRQRHPEVNPDGI